MDTEALQETISATLAKSLSNLTLSILNPLVNVTPPKFALEKDQVIEWLDQFDQITHAASEDHKKKLLAVSLINAARAWYVNDLEPVREGLSWADIKKRLLKRYSPNTKDHYVEKLSSLKYSRERYPDLASYVDQRVHLAKKAYPTMKEKEVIRDTIITLPPTIRRELSLMTDTSKLTTCLLYTSDAADE